MRRGVAHAKILSNNRDESLECCAVQDHTGNSKSEEVSAYLYHHASLLTCGEATRQGSLNCSEKAGATGAAGL